MQGKHLILKMVCEKLLIIKTACRKAIPCRLWLHTWAGPQAPPPTDEADNRND